MIDMILIDYNHDMTYMIMKTDTMYITRFLTMSFRTEISEYPQLSHLSLFMYDIACIMKIFYLHYKPVNLPYIYLRKTTPMKHYTTVSSIWSYVSQSKSINGTKRYYTWFGNGLFFSTQVNSSMIMA